MKRANNREYIVCPVCGGKGKVPNGFYTWTEHYWPTTSAAAETCRTCNGTGIIFETENKKIFPK